jgi:4-oxalocrotonate tautomerase
MPIVQINIMEGRDDDKKDRLIAEVTDAICRSLEVKPETVRVMINEMPKAHFGIGGVSAKKLGR